MRRWLWILVIALAAPLLLVGFAPTEESSEEAAECDVRFKGHYNTATAGLPDHWRKYDPNGGDQYSTKPYPGSLYIDFRQSKVKGGIWRRLQSRWSDYTEHGISDAALARDSRFQWTQHGSTKRVPTSFEDLFRLRMACDKNRRYKIHIANMSTTSQPKKRYVDLDGDGACGGVKDPLVIYYPSKDGWTKNTVIDLGNLAVYGRFKRMCN